ncbi:MAG TPA: signal peptide peptidase SppA, partial [Kofleriaceae bacterium]|nr:signal peptide peptidase SppA [Kofleriaceae bacterium]
LASRRLAVVLVCAAVPAPAAAQETRRYAEDPTGGVDLPTGPLAGDADATAVSLNPAGLQFLGGPAVGAVLGAGRERKLTSAGPGFGVFVAGGVGGGLLPRFGIGVGLENLRPPRALLTPDPGSPTRLTLASSVPLSPRAGFGFAWRHFFDDGHSLDAVDTYDLGLSMRFGAHFAAAAVVRDLTTPRVAGGNVERRWEGEVVTRPLATDRLELGLGGRVGDDHGDVDGWLRLSARVVRGFYLRAGAESRVLRIIDTTASGDVIDSQERELRLAAGIELSFGGLGIASYGTGAIDADRDGRLIGGTLVARISEEEVPSLLPAGRRIEKLELSGGMSSRAHTALIAALQRVERDGDVAALLVKVDGLDVGWACAEEIRNQLLAIRKAGKKVMVYMVEGTGRDYYVASAADRIWVDPAGGVRLAGMSGTQLHFRDLFDKIGVNPQFEKIEEYKSAPEMFTNSAPSEPALRMRDELYDAIYGAFVAAIASGRKLDPAVVHQLIDGGPYSAGDLEHSPLIDGVATPRDLDRLVAATLGGRYPLGEPANRRPERWSYPAIAVIHIDGDIVDGDSAEIPLLGRKLVGADTISRTIAAARADRNVKAIVLRVDSPGGSAVASEVISREVFATRGVKPIICSMGDVAASGGYFVSAGCDRIFAEPTTITGSIGIFYGKFDLSQLLSRLGVTWATFKRGQRADMESFFRPFTDDERAFLKTRLRYFYGRFVKAVATGRGLTETQVDDIGRGHVWAGSRARTIKLVDEMGGVGDAIRYAKRRAGMGERELAQLLLLPRAPRSLLQQLTGLPGVHAEADAGRASQLSWLPGADLILRALPGSLLWEPRSLQARLPFGIVWDD